MKRMRDRVAGLDVHRDTVEAFVRVLDGGEVGGDRAAFRTTAAALADLARWLAAHDVTTVAMEATGIYWRPVYYALEGLFDEVWVCNAAHVKNVPGRKTDASDAEWLADVAAHGMVRPSFVPPPAVRELRELVRYRKTQIDARGREIQRLERLLQDAGIKLTSVASRAWSMSAKTMVEALISGERDPAVLAQLAKGRLRPKIPQLTEALANRFRSHHGAVARQILAHIEFLDGSIATLTTEIAERSGPFEAAMALLCTIPGVKRLTAEAFVAETGADMTRWPTSKHFAAWAGLAPGNHESAGRRRQVAARHGAPALRRVLVEAARAAAATKGSYFSAQYRRIAARRGPNKAAVAVAHSIAVAAWHMLQTGEPYRDPGADFFSTRDATASTKRLVRQLEALGHTVVIDPAA